jgi:hypothetical protein
MHHTIVYRNPQKLVPHEQVDQQKLASVIRSIKRSGGIRHPVVIDRESNVILDGHHRCRAYIELGMAIVPCIAVNYFDPNITLTFRRKDIGMNIVKKGIIYAATHGNVFSHKTTKHRIPNRTKIVVKV